jgi:hypothetical protein
LGRKSFVTALVACAALASTTAYAQQSAGIDPSFSATGSDVPFNGARMDNSIGWGPKWRLQIFAAGASDVRPGRRILDANGYFLGSVVKVDGTQVMVRERGRAATIPLSAFLHDRIDLRLPITVGQFRARARAQAGRT